MSTAIQRHARATPGFDARLAGAARCFEATLAWLDIHSLAPTEAQALGANDIGHVVVEVQQPLPLEPYEASRTGGALIVVDPASHRASGALLVRRAAGERGAKPA